MTEENNQDKEINDSQKSTTNNEETLEGITKDSNLLGLAFNFIIKLLKSENLKDPKTIILIIALTYGTLITLYMGGNINLSSNETKNPEEQQPQKFHEIDDMSEVCRDLKKDSKEFQRKIKKRLQIEDLDEVTKIEGTLRNKGAYAKTWPVFRWLCEVEVKKENTTSFDKETTTTTFFGIALDEYCRIEYPPKDKEYKPFYKSYDDPDSWYCVLVPGDYLDEHQ